MNTKEREKLIKTETKILKKTINVLLSKEYYLGVYDGEDHTIGNSTDKKKIFEALRSTDDDFLVVYKDNKRTGQWVRFVYGNSGWDVICDYTTGLEDDLKEVNEYADSLEAT